MLNSRYFDGRIDRARGLAVAFLNCAKHLPNMYRKSTLHITIRICTAVCSA